MSPEIATLCELVLNPEILHLELADDSKVQSTQKADNVKVCVGKSICRVDFTVTKLLKDVDLVLESIGSHYGILSSTRKSK